jgi:hypothetical protein
MTEVGDPAKTLEAVRDKLVDERRALAVALALGHRRRRTDDPHVNETRSAFIDIQRLIEAVDRAIAHEKLSKNGHLLSEALVLETAPSITAGAANLETVGSSSLSIIDSN